jgi:hypothetical protein
MVTASADETRTLCARLLAFNQAHGGDSLDETPVRLAWHDEHGALRGGVLADVCAGWLRYMCCGWIRNCAGKASASACWRSRSRRAPAWRPQRDAGYLRLAGRSFYLRQGYTVYGRLPDCPPGHERIYLRKPLSGS